MLGVDDFKSLVSNKGGIARANLFSVSLPGLPGIATNEEMNLLCKDVSLPGRQVTTRERTEVCFCQNLPKKETYIGWAFFSDWSV